MFHIPRIFKYLPGQFKIRVKVLPCALQLLFLERRIQFFPKIAVHAGDSTRNMDPPQGVRYPVAARSQDLHNPSSTNRSHVFFSEGIEHIVMLGRSTGVSHPRSEDG
jgi:hypothetical protein